MTTAFVIKKYIQNIYKIYISNKLVIIIFYLFKTFIIYYYIILIKPINNRYYINHYMIN